MKALKQFLSILIVLSLMILSACSDSITSSLNSVQEKDQSPLTGSSERGASYSSSFTLNAGEYILLHSGITLLKNISEYSVSNCSNSRFDLHLSASNIGMLRSLPCESSEHVLNDLLIENISGQVKKITVKMTGLPVKSN